MSLCGGRFSFKPPQCASDKWKNVAGLAFNTHLKAGTTTKMAKECSRLKVTKQAESSKAMDLKKKNGIQNWEYSKLWAFDNISILWKNNYFYVNGNLLLWKLEAETQKKTNRGRIKFVCVVNSQPL